MDTKIDFINGNMKKSLGLMVLPLMAAMFLNMAYNLVDSLWIGNLLGETAYAALTNSTPIILILNAVAMGMGNGVAILLSQAIGANEKEKTERLIMTSLVMAVVFSLGVMVILEIFLRPVLILLNTPEEVMEPAWEYLAVYLIGYLAVYLYCYFTAVLRSFGNSIFQVIAMLICTLLNGILDPVFIHFMGFQGAAVWRSGPSWPFCSGDLVRGTFVRTLCGQRCRRCHCPGIFPDRQRRVCAEYCDKLFSGKSERNGEAGEKSLLYGFILSDHPYAFCMGLI